MKQQFESPEVSQHYPEEEEADSDKDDNKKFDNKKEQIQGFCLQVLSMAPTLFKHCLTAKHVKLSLSVLVPVAFSKGGSDLLN